MRLRKFFFGLLAGLFILTGPSMGLGFAQGDLDRWQQPVNLSESGSATNPAVVVDSDGVIHTFWTDAFRGSIYTSSVDGSEWSEPLSLTLPFDEATPALFASQDGYVHAFWIITDGDKNTLYYSRSDNNSIGAGGWSGREMLAENALDFAVALSEEGDLYLTYLRSLEDASFPAGVYFRSSSDGGASWSFPTILYQSAYYRGLLPDRANVDIASASSSGNSLVYVVWDNPARKQVLLRKSVDGGETWSDSMEIDRPTEDTGLTDPYNILVEANGDDVLLLWQAGLQSGFACTQHFQWSQDQGENWAEKQIMLDDLVGCPQGTQFYPGEEEIDYMLTNVQERFYMLAWNWEKHVWSDAQVQSELSSLTNPETLEAVSLSCRQTYAGGSERLYLVGCDTVGPSDIWLTSRQFGTKAEWFIEEPVWSAPVNISSAEDISYPTVLPDPNGGVHVIWSQRNDRGSESSSSNIYYSQNSGGSWQEGVRIVSSPQGNADQPAAALDPSGRLHLVWSGDLSGQIYYSWASASLANHPREWTPPLALPSPVALGSAPDIAVGEDGSVYVAFSVPINEARGVYLLRSTDGGRTWMDPVRIFDAVQAQWAMVNQPKIAYSENGQLHLLFSQYALPGRGESMGLYYVQSTDGGQTWSQVSEVVAKPIAWYEIIDTPGQEVHRFWSEMESGVPVLWQQISTDDGISWGVPANLSRVGEISGLSSVVTDSSGKLLLVQAVQEQDGGVFIKSFSWDQQQWKPMENLLLFGTESVLDITSLAAGGGPQGDVYVAFGKKAEQGVISLTERTENNEDSPPQLILSVASRSQQINGETEEELPTASSTQIDEITPTQSQEIQATQDQEGEAAEATPSPTPDLRLALNTSPLSPTDGQGGAYIGLIVGIVIAILITVITFGLRMRALQRRG